jgi:hypothetical protein
MRDLRIRRPDPDETPLSEAEQWVAIWNGFLPTAYEAPSTKREELHHELQTGRAVPDHFHTRD